MGRCFFSIADLIRFMQSTANLSTVLCDGLKTAVASMTSFSNGPFAGLWRDSHTHVNGR